MKRIVILALAALIVAAAVAPALAAKKEVAVRFTGLRGATITFEEKKVDIYDTSSKPEKKQAFGFPVAVEFEVNFEEKKALEAVEDGEPYSPRKPHRFRIDVDDEDMSILFGEIIVYRLTDFAERSLVQVKITPDQVAKVMSGQVLVLRFDDPSHAQGIEEGDADVDAEMELVEAATSMGLPSETEVCRVMLGNRPNDMKIKKSRSSDDDDDSSSRRRRH